MDKFGKPVKNARILVKGIRHDITTGEHPPGTCVAAAPGRAQREQTGGVLQASAEAGANPGSA